MLPGRSGRRRGCGGLRWAAVGCCGSGPSKSQASPSRPTSARERGFGGTGTRMKPPLLPDSPRVSCRSAPDLARQQFTRHGSGTALLGHSLSQACRLKSELQSRCSRAENGLESWRTEESRTPEGTQRKQPGNPSLKFSGWSGACPGCLGYSHSGLSCCKLASLHGLCTTVVGQRI